MGFRFLEHTADALAECRAETFHGVLESAAQALYALALHEGRPEAGESRAIHVTGDAREDLLIRWLQELIFLLETEQFVATAFAFGPEEPRTVSAQVHGYLCAPEDRAEEVKSATYHKLEVTEVQGELVARVVFDL